MEERISKNEKFTAIYCDLDNFKASNDKYGIYKGDDAIKLTAEIFKKAAQKRRTLFKTGCVFFLWHRKV